MKVVYAGSFDPVTNGHLDIVERSAATFEDLIVAVANNPQKKPVFTVEERMLFIREVTKHIPNVQVETFSGLLVEYLQKEGYHTVVRGLRAVTDFEMEFQMALINKKLYPKMETVFLVTRADYSFLSSSMIKEVAYFGGCVKSFVPPIVEENLKKKLGSL